jgi:Prokaryotic membrane lipoprotein lipid attachment site
MKKSSVWLLALLAAVALAGCAMQKAPAEQAVASAETALAAVRDQAQKYVPDQLQAVQAQLDSAKDSLAKGDYKTVLAAAPQLNAAISSLKDAASAKQAETEAALAKAKDAWGPLSSDVPKMVDAISSRVDVLSKSRHLPKGVTKQTLASAKSSVDTMKSAWNDASNAAGAGDYSSAVSKGQAVKDQATQVMQSLGMSSS